MVNVVFLFPAFLDALIYNTAPAIQNTHAVEEDRNRKSRVGEKAKSQSGLI